jgi:hypothetical protein
MICCYVGFGTVALFLAARRFVRVRIPGGEEQPDPAAWRLNPGSR